MLLLSNIQITVFYVLWPKRQFQFCIYCTPATSAVLSWARNNQVTVERSIRCRTEIGHLSASSGKPEPLSESRRGLSSNHQCYVLWWWAFNHFRFFCHLISKKQNVDIFEPFEFDRFVLWLSKLFKMYNHITTGIGFKISAMIWQNPWWIPISSNI